MRQLALAAILVALILTGGIAGFFYAYSVSVMPGLDEARPEVAIEAMQGINRAVRNPVFFVSFFLTPAATLLAGALTFHAGARKAALALLLAVLVYLAGAFAPTALVNVPMNESLADVRRDTTVTEAAPIWKGYSPLWTQWNHLRTAASAISLLLVGLALVLKERKDRSVT